MTKTDDTDGYEFEVPKELQPWVEHQKEKSKEAAELGFRHYILVNGKIKQVDFWEFVKWFNSPERLIDQIKIGEVFVSTVFLGSDYNFNFDEWLEHKPILFESMVFKGELDQFQWRYSTYGEAKQGHREIVAAVRENRQPILKFGEAGFWGFFKDMFDE